MRCAVADGSISAVGGHGRFVVCVLDDEESIVLLGYPLWGDVENCSLVYAQHVLKSEKEGSGCRLSRALSECLNLMSLLKKKA